MRISPATLAAIASLALAPCPHAQGAPAQPRPPAVPLITHDPYLSIWSQADHLADVETTHWTGKPHPIHVLARIDDRTYRLVGKQPAEIPAAKQVALRVLPTRTICEFEAGGASITLTFLTPALPDDLDLLSRPVTALMFDVKGVDGKRHTAKVCTDLAPDLAVHTLDQRVRAERIANVTGLVVARVGTVVQPVLARQGDDTRIDWGHALLAIPDAPGNRIAIADGNAARAGFARDGAFPAGDATPKPEAPASEAHSLLALADLGEIGEQTVSRHLLVGYDDQWSILYFDEPLRPYWRRDGRDTGSLLATTERDLATIARRCRAFDDALTRDMTRIGGPGYAALCALAYRQTLAGSKLAADRNGMPLFFPKENHSNGCIATVDVIYPMAPFCLLFSPALTRALLVPVFDYAASPRWKFPFAPHDLGRYPHATGQVYGGGEQTEDRQMMVEESANLVILAAALARAEGDTAFPASYWPLLRRWADYLAEKGFDPENQLCTDDFAGHLAHNVNLSAKAILALGAFGKLAAQRGDQSVAQRFDKLARDMAARWVRAAADGDHTRLAFDRPGSWSQKYNLVWDRLLDLALFPKEILRAELDFYRRSQNLYGLPLDSRSTYTKLDWILWTASITGERADLDALLAPVLHYLDSTRDRIPMTDWYFTDTARRRGFTARPVVGGVFIAALGDVALWKATVQRGARLAGPWAPIPIRPTRAIVPTSETDAIPWRTSNRRPPRDWSTPGFDAGKWTEAPAPFGLGPNTRTRWADSELWLRREFDLPTIPEGDLRIRILHGHDAEILLNGIPAARCRGDLRGYVQVAPAKEAIAQLRPGKNVIAIHARPAPQGPRRRSFIDAGLVELLPAPAR